MMSSEQIQQELEKINQQIKALNEDRCEGLVCTTNEHDKTLKLEDLLEKRVELYYHLNIEPETIDIKKGKKLKGNDTQKLEIAKNLLDVLDDSTISLKLGVEIEEVEKLRKDNQL